MDEVAQLDAADFLRRLYAQFAAQTCMSFKRRSGSRSTRLRSDVGASDQRENAQCEMYSHASARWPLASPSQQAPRLPSRKVIRLVSPRRHGAPAYPAQLRQPRQPQIGRHVPQRDIDRRTRRQIRRSRTRLPRRRQSGLALRAGGTRSKVINSPEGGLAPQSGRRVERRPGEEDSRPAHGCDHPAANRLSHDCPLRSCSCDHVCREPLSRLAK